MENIENKNDSINDNKKRKKFWTDKKIAVSIIMSIVLCFSYFAAHNKVEYFVKATLLKRWIKAADAESDYNIVKYSNDPAEANSHTHIVSEWGFNYKLKAGTIKEKINYNDLCNDNIDHSVRKMIGSYKLSIMELITTYGSNNKYGYKHKYNKKNWFFQGFDDHWYFADFAKLAIVEKPYNIISHVKPSLVKGTQATDWTISKAFKATPVSTTNWSNDKFWGKVNVTIINKKIHKSENFVADFTDELNLDINQHQKYNINAWKIGN